MTPRQMDALKCVAGYIRSHGYAPTVRELGDMIGVGTKSTGATKAMLERLITQNLLCRPERGSRARNLVVTAKGEQLLADLSPSEVKS